VSKFVHEKNYEQWSGLSEKYHNDRPLPPEVIIKIILSWLQNDPETVVDVGSGTGLSTIIWKDIAKNIIGIEPNDDMRLTAEKRYSTEPITFKKGVSNDIELPSDYTDIITVSQAFHWMDIESTLLEFYRILKYNGVLAIYDFVLPPVICWEIEKASFDLRKMFSDVVYKQEEPPIKNDKCVYKDKIISFGKFRYTREVECHKIVVMTPQRIADFLVGISNASFAVKINPALKRVVDDFYELVMDKYKDEVETVLPYKMVIAVK
jgi:ubiquinone/menaquinone biosynthesis C-methylase UbiE